MNPTVYSKKFHPELVEYVDLSNTKWGRIQETVEYAWDAAPTRARLGIRTGDTIVGTVRPGNGSLIGRASCREREEISVDAVSSNIKNLI